MINLSTDDFQTQGGNKSVKPAGSLSKVNNRKHHTGVAQYIIFQNVKDPGKQFIYFSSILMHHAYRTIEVQITSGNWIFLY